jgi:hypothetical protein
MREVGQAALQARRVAKRLHGPEHMTYGYGNENEPRRCNDHGRSPVVAMYGRRTSNDRDAGTGSG